MIDKKTSLHKNYFFAQASVSLWCLLLFCIPFKGFNQGCAISSEVTIVAEGSSNVILNVDGLVNDDLATNQSLCGVRLVFEHDLIENIRMVLVSPSGQRVTLIGPGRLNSNPSPFVSWNIALLPCTVPPSPDAGISGVWDNGEPWAAFTNYTGVYHPFDNCLEDFNLGSANGSWTLEIENLGDIQGLLEYFELIFCDPTGSMCSECFLFAGNFNFSTPGGIYTFCEADPSADLMGFELDQDSILTSSQDYTFLYSRNDTIIKRSDSPNEISDLSPGTYTLCGLAYQSNIINEINDQLIISRLDSLADSRSICADLTEDCITLRILEIENKVTIDTTFCDGDSISFFGKIFFDDLDTTVIISNLLQDNCDSLITFSARKKTVESIINSSSDVSQCGNSVFLNGSNSNTDLGQIDNYEWTTNDGQFEIDIGPIAEISSGGTYYLRSFSEFCYGIDSITIQQIDTFDWSFNSTTPLCYLDSFVLNVVSNPSGVDFSIDNTSVIEQIEDQSFYTYDEGLYEMVASLGTCNDTLEFTLMHEATELSLSVSSSVITCLNDTSRIVINTNAINPSFELSGPEMGSVLMDTISVVLGGAYELKVMDESGCAISQNLTIIEEKEEPDFQLQDLSRLCNEAVPGLSAIINTPFDSVVWNGPDNFFSSELSATPELEGTYELTVYGTNGCDLTQSLIYTIENVPFDLQITNQDIDCENESIEVCLDNPGNGDLVWTFNNDIISTDECFIASAEGMYYIEVTDGDMCKALDSVFINDFREQIDVNLNFDPQSLYLSCNQTDVDLSFEINGSQENLTVQWFEGQNLIGNNSNFTVGEPLEITLLITDTTTKCKYQETFTIAEITNPFLNFDFDVFQPECLGDFGALNPILPLGWDDFDVFLNGSMIFNSSEFQMLTPGDYTLELIDDNSCFIDTSFTILKGRELTLDLGGDIETIFGNTVSISAEVNINESEIASFDWSNSDSLSCNFCLSPSFSVYSNEEVILTLTDEFGCEVSDTLQIIIDSAVKYFVPNVFSPNDDGDNDNLTIYLSDAILKVFDLSVRDRWGNLVLFRPEILNENDILVWDGLFEGKPVVQGVYVYMAKLLLLDGTETLITGNITVIR